MFLLLRHSAWACLSVSLFLAGCATKAAFPCATTRNARVFFATDRKHSDEGPIEYGNMRTKPPALQMGFQDIQIGAKHKFGILDEAVAVTPPREQRSSVGQPASKALHRTDREIYDYVGTTLRSIIRNTKPPARDGVRKVFLYVHGFNNTFDYAIRKTAQMAGDLELISCNGEQRGLAITYSWPSKGNVFGYLADEENAEWTQQRMVPFLQALSAVCKQEHAELHVIAHSMGARVTIRSLAEIAHSADRLVTGKLIKQFILLAPDIGKSLFDQYAERVLPMVEHLTIYVQAKDRALLFSSFLHGNGARLGLLEGTILTALRLTGLRSEDNRDLGLNSDTPARGSQIDMIDVSGGLTDFLGHSYEDKEFIHDVRELLYYGTPAGTGARANLQAKSARPGLFGLTGKRLQYFKLETKQ